MKKTLTLTPPLTDDQRSELGKSAEWIAALLRKTAQIEKRVLDLLKIKSRLLDDITNLEAKADLDRQGCADLLAAQMQLARLERTISNADRDDVALLVEMTGAANAIRGEIIDVHRPLVATAKDFLTELLAPYSRAPHEAQEQANDSYIVESLRLFTGPYGRVPVSFETREQALTALRGLSAHLESLLKNEPILFLPPKGGEFTRPAFV